MEAYISTLTSKGQLTLPKHLREMLKIKAGQTVLMEPLGNAVVLKKALIKAAEDEFTRDEWEQLGALMSEKGRRYKTAGAFLKSLK
ncbi:MAG: AbrB/MazE/SpoVT family DNA-binding domain-containing protein [Deltaproteobacteria bacterium]|nr:AbrB/MazE/SpoVT family DNA-binding domain-containing protein [Deltaproteobacteria bacterium]